MRDGDWSLLLRVGGVEMTEHQIDGHTCVTAPRGEAFEIVVRYHGSGQAVYYVEVDGIQADPWQHWMDADGTAREKQKVERVLTAWEKSHNGQTTKRPFLFQSRAAKSGADDADSRPAGEVDWSHGHVTIRAYRGKNYVRKHSHLPRGGSGSASGSASSSTVDEQTMVKSGLSTTAGAGQATFFQERVMQAGTFGVQKADPNEPPSAELKLYYRDSFFMLLREDTCCGGACRLRGQRAARLREAADELDDTQSGAAGSSGAAGTSGAGAAAGGRKRKAREVRERQMSVAETKEKLASGGMADGEEPIDLISGDEDDNHADGADKTKPLVVD